MTICIEKLSKENGTTFLQGTANTKTGSVFIGRHSISVCAHNAAAAVKRNLGGKVFFSRESALAGYKSSEMKALIQAAFDAHDG